MVWRLCKIKKFLISGVEFLEVDIDFDKGFEIAKKIQNQHPRIPTIVLKTVFG